ncbi:hypothetical protein B0T14DRAFT_422031, partial [Immersiella caudata]
QIYKTTCIRSATHNRKGLSKPNIVMAGICDSAAKDQDGIIIEELDDASTHKFVKSGWKAD